MIKPLTLSQRLLERADASDEDCRTDDGDIMREADEALNRLAVDASNHAADAEAVRRERDHLIAESARLRKALKEASDLLAERVHGSPARSPGHNARVVMEYVLKEQVDA
jgi:hypothetical protein